MVIEMRYLMVVIIVHGFCVSPRIFHGALHHICQTDILQYHLI